MAENIDYERWAVANDPNNGRFDPKSNRPDSINDPINQGKDPDNGLDGPINDPKNSISIPMTQNPTIAYNELAASINKSTSTEKRYIHELKASGAISRIGGTKGGRWEVEEG